MIRKVTRQKASHQVLAQLKAGINDGTFPVGESCRRKTCWRTRSASAGCRCARRSACWRSAASSPHARAAATGWNSIRC